MDVHESIVVVGCIAVVSVVAMKVLNAGSRRRLLHKERMSAIEKGVPLPEDLLADAEANCTPGMLARRAAIQGTVWTALGLGMLVAGRLVRSADVGSELRQFLAFLEVWAFPAMFVGVGLLLFAFFTRDRKAS